MTNNVHEEAQTAQKPVKTFLFRQKWFYFVQKPFLVSETKMKNVFQRFFFFQEKTVFSKTFFGVFITF
jgi:hypothetical protein